MSSYTEQMTQELGIADYLAPANTVNSATAVNTSGIDMSKFNRVIYMITIGGMTGAGNVAAQLQTCLYSGFNSGVHNMTGGSITVVTNANPNSVVTLETTADAINQQNAGDRYVRASITIGANSVVFGVVGMGGVAIQEPGNAQNLNTTLIPQQLVVT